ncbi:MAG: extracellular solute-binding protein [Lachnospiraceae bacterium]|nr:extracellular solute-binding protein [Lachnospiraceae bacterium]
MNGKRIGNFNVPKKVFALGLSLITCASLLAGCGKDVGSSGSGLGALGSATSDLPEQVYVAEFTSLPKGGENSSYDATGGIIKDGVVSLVKNDYSGDTNKSFISKLSIPDGDVLSEVEMGSNLSDFINVQEMVPDEYKDRAQVYTGINGYCELSDGTGAAPIYASWYCENEEAYGSTIYIALFNSDGTVINCKKMDMSAVAQNSENLSVSYFCADSKDNIIAMLSDWSGSDPISYAVVFDKDLNLKNNAKLDEVMYFNGLEVCGESVYIIYQDSNWENKVAEFDAEGCRLCAPLEITLKNADINGIDVKNGKAYITSYDKLYEFDIEKKELKEVLKWLDIDIADGMIRKLSASDDGSFVGITYDYETNDAEIVSIKLVDRDEIKDRAELVIVSLYEDYSLKRDVIDFNKANSDAHVTLKSYVDWSNGDVDEKDALNTMINDITGAAAPDMINLSGLNTDSLVKQNIIEDITPYIENAGSIKLDDFNEVVVDAYRYGDLLCTVPKRFEVQTLAVNKNKFGDKAGWKLEDMIKADMADPNSTILEYSNRMSILSLCLYNNIDYFINPETGECKFDSDEFKSILEYVATFPEEINWDVVDVDSNPVEKLASGKIIAYESYFYNLQSVQEYADYIFGGNANFIGYPTIDGSPSALITTSGTYAICTSSDKKDAAWKFLEYTITKNDDSDSFGFPTNKKAMQALVDEELKHNGEKTGSGMSYGSGDMYEYHYAVQDEIDIINEVLSQARLKPADDNEIFKIIDEETGSYFAGQKSVDDTAKIIQSRVNLYVQENR